MKRLLAEILQLTSENLRNAEEIRSITEEMQEHIRREDMDSLNRALDRRQAGIDRVDRIHASIDSKIEELAGKGPARKIEEIDRYPEAKEILDIREEIRKINRRICEMEKDNLRNAQALLEEYKDTIQGIKKNRKAMRVYGGNDSRKQSILLNEVK